MTFDEWFNSEEGQAVYEPFTWEGEAAQRVIKNALQMAFHAGKI
jgi:hypothetical protein